jgi:pyruvate/2-oxoglutarate dehydrogenase complex dihydrolipoamide dehydrogenase (E3) component
MIPRATYCQPQIGSFGYSEQQAKDKGYDVKTAKFPFSANGKAHGLGRQPASSSSSPTPNTGRSSVCT